MSEPHRSLIEAVARALGHPDISDAGALFDAMALEHADHARTLSVKSKRRVIVRLHRDLPHANSEAFVAAVIREMRAKQGRRLCARMRQVEHNENVIRKQAQKRLAKKIKATVGQPASRLMAQPEHAVVLSQLPEAKFYRTKEWRQTRWLALQAGRGACLCCGARAETGAVLHVDHIIPRLVRPDLALELGNLRVLCEDCHRGRHGMGG